ncbi:N-acetyl-alpha-D-muramate 1-phosphate uridylyltransferase [Methylocystis bryophila]|uniref:Mannose-1-phosphate guanylyltransferase n=2 Tax=Methylocystis bryophila TaxID=655015 RepID=A0A1W6MYT8_9HYPH|nr:mannose-1-phosphate guanylyltransferase [Methylocystis bryophila]
MTPEAVSLPQAAMVFAAGLGTRMRPLTETTPKPLVQVGGRPLLDHVLDQLSGAGVAKAIVNVHHLGDQIIAHLAARRSPDLVISDERAKLLDQGGGIKKALPLLGSSPFYICNTDAFWREEGAENIRALARFYDAERMDAALLLAETQSSLGVDWDGDFEIDASGRLHQPPGRRRFVYTGVGILAPRLFENIAEEVFKLSPFFFDAAKRERLFGLPARGLWMHVGSVAAIAEAERALSANAP